MKKTAATTVLFAIIYTQICFSTSLADVVFSDSLFPDSAWAQEIVTDSAAGGTSAASFSQQASGGNPGPYQLTTITFPYLAGSPQSVLVGNFLDVAAFDPTQSGEILNLAFSIDYNLISQSGGTPGASVGALLRQNATLYRGPITQTLPNAGTWTPLTFASLTPSDFVRIAGTGDSVPDFSGTSIDFGYFTGVGAASGPTSVINTSLGVDNFQYHVTAVPEPSSALFCAVACVSTAMRFRLRKNKA